MHVEGKCPGSVALPRAQALFAKLGLERTRERNGVLIYVATADRRFAVIGDTGIHEEVGSQFWAEAVARMGAAFRQGAFGDGLVGAIESVGKRLAERFPPKPGGVNQLGDDISTDENPT